MSNSLDVPLTTARKASLLAKPQVAPAKLGAPCAGKFCILCWRRAEQMIAERWKT